MGDPHRSSKGSGRREEYDSPPPFGSSSRSVSFPEDYWSTRPTAAPYRYRAYPAESEYAAAQPRPAAYGGSASPGGPQAYGEDARTRVQHEPASSYGRETSPNDQYYELRDARQEPRTGSEYQSRSSQHGHRSTNTVPVRQHDPQDYQENRYTYARADPGYRPPANPISYGHPGPAYGGYPEVSRRQPVHPSRSSLVRDPYYDRRPDLSEAPRGSGVPPPASASSHRPPPPAAPPPPPPQHRHTFGGIGFRRPSSNLSSDTTRSVPTTSIGVTDRPFSIRGRTDSFQSDRRHRHGTMVRDYYSRYSMRWSTLCGFLERTFPGMSFTRKLDATKDEWVFMIPRKLTPDERAELEGLEE